MKKACSLFCTCLCVLLLVACDNSASQPSSVPSSPASAPASAQTETVTPSSEPETSNDENNPQKHSYVVGDTIVTENWEITIESAELTKSINPQVNKMTINHTSDDEKSYLLVKFAIKNTTAETCNVPSSADLNSYVDGEKILCDVITGEVDGHIVQIGALSGGKTGKYYTVWQVPDTSEKFEFTVFTYDAHYNFSESDPVLIDLNDLKS